MDILIAVEDTGIGIPEHKTDCIFEAFRQVDSGTSRRYGGTGLGLFIARELARLLGGEIHLESELGMGSTFTCDVPLAVPTDGPAQLTSLPLAPERADGCRVLVVEDNPINQKVATHLLGKWGHRVTVANNGQEALDRLDGAHFDVVLMDMQMPVMGGVEATQRIRRRETEQNLPRLRIVAMTANALEADRTACLAAGMDDYLSKPFKAAELAAKLVAASPTRI